MTLESKTKNIWQVPSANSLWWLIFGIILLAGTLLYFTGYDYGLPFYERVDERRNLYEIYLERGLVDMQTTKPGYPPGILWVNYAGQLITEARTGQSAWDTPTDVIKTLRVVVIFVSLSTTTFVALSARKLAGDLAGWLAAAIWLFAPRVLYQASAVLPPTWEALTYTMTLYFTLLALEKKHAGWAFASTLAGLGAILFKYSTFPMLGLGVAVSLWYLRSDRKKWLKTLGFQFGAIILCAIWLLLIYGAIDIADNPEPNQFVQGGFLKVFDFELGWFLLDNAMQQIGQTALSFLVITILGSYALWKNTEATWLRLGWILTLGAAFVHNWFLATFIVYLDQADRYTASASGLMVIVIAVAVMQIARWLANRINQPAVTYLVTAGFVGIWLIPQFISVRDFTLTRALPLTQKGFVDWTVDTLPDGDETIIVNESMLFDRNWGGYVGPTRPYVEDDILTRSIEDWLDLHVYYAQVTGEQLEAYEDNPEWQGYLDQMLLLKQFPPPGEEGFWRTHRKWDGDNLYIYQLWRMENETDVTFGDQIRLIGYDLSTTETQADTPITLRLYWQANTQPAIDYQIFVHLTPIDDATQLLAQHDASPGANRRPTSTWNDTSEIIRSDPFEIQLPADVKAGEYRLAIGLYDWQTGQRLMTADGNDSFIIETIDIFGNE